MRTQICPVRSPRNHSRTTTCLQGLKHNTQVIYNMGQKHKLLPAFSTQHTWTYLGQERKEKEGVLQLYPNCHPTQQLLFLIAEFQPTASFQDYKTYVTEDCFRFFKAWLSWINTSMNLSLWGQLLQEHPDSVQKPHTRDVWVFFPLEVERAICWKEVEEFQGLLVKHFVTSVLKLEVQELPH